MNYDTKLKCCYLNDEAQRQRDQARSEHAKDTAEFLKAAARRMMDYPMPDHIPGDDPVVVIPIMHRAINTQVRITLTSA